MIPEKFPQGKPSKTLQRERLSDWGISYPQSSRWQKIAGIDDQDFELYVLDQIEKNEELTTAGMLRWFANIHVSDDSYEWNTPPEIIEAAREVMGSIDLDPATNETAQETIKAGKYFTAEDDGLEQEWSGTVWLNPPYSMPYVQQFTDRAIYEYENGNLPSALVLVNNCTDTGWFHRLLEYPVCFTKGRIPFWGDGGKTLATRQGQAIFYLGEDVERFANAFSEFGVVVIKYDHQ